MFQLRTNREGTYAIFEQVDGYYIEHFASDETFRMVNMETFFPLSDELGGIGHAVPFTQEFEDLLRDFVESDINGDLLDDPFREAKWEAELLNPPLPSNKAIGDLIAAVHNVLDAWYMPMDDPRRGGLDANGRHQQGQRMNLLVEAIQHLDEVNKRLTC